jgi:thiosulfate/3-mercaptopyruvate sulfurtransferase
MTPNTLVSTQWLHDHLHDPDLRIVDIRGHVIPATEPPPHYFNHHADYLTSHIPGAVFIDWVREITDPADPRHAQIAPPERYAAAMQRAGINANTMVVAYDDAAGMFAARLWWTIQYYGHTRVAVLDGGWKKWLAEGRPVSADVPTVTPGTFIPRPNPAIYRDGEQVLAALGASTTLLDVRSPAEFNGESSRAKRMGHIPGAKNQSRHGLYNPADETMLQPDALRVKFAESGVTANSPEVIVYCNAGVSASYGLLALRVAGIETGAVYDGSWKDWGNDESKPIE